VKHFHRWLYYALALLIAVLAYGYIAHRLCEFDNWSAISKLLEENTTGFIGILLLQLALLVINLALESGKWHLLINHINKQLFTQSIKQVLSGSAVAIVTPGRIGEPIGRLYRIAPGHRTQAITFSLLGSMMQTGVIAVGGFFGLVYWLVNKHLPLTVASLGQITRYLFMLAIVAAVVIVLLLCYSGRIKWFLRQRKSLRIWLSVKRIDWVLPLLLTFLRYVCFVGQFAIWLIFFKIEIVPTAMIFTLLIYFFIITIVPSFLLADLGLRGSVALLLFGALTQQSVLLILATFMLWFVNVAIPAMAGSFIVLAAVRNRKRV